MSDSKMSDCAKPTSCSPKSTFKYTFCHTRLSSTLTQKSVLPIRPAKSAKNSLQPLLLFQSSCKHTRNVYFETLLINLDLFNLYLLRNIYAIGSCFCMTFLAMMLIRGFFLLKILISKFVNFDVNNKNLAPPCPSCCC